MKQNNPPLEARKRKYAENKQRKDKANREKRRMEKREGKMKNRRLSFIVNILNTYRITRTELAKRLGETTQNMYWIFSVQDDCALSKAREIFATIGLRLSVQINKKSAHNKTQTIDYVTAGNVTSKVVFKFPEHASVYRAVKIPKYISDYPDGKYLSFLARYLENVGYSISEIEKMTSVSRGSIRQTFVNENDDIAISRIYDIARATNGEITWFVDEL